MIGLLAEMDGKSALEFAKSKWSLADASVATARRFVQQALDMAAAAAVERQQIEGQD